MRVSEHANYLLNEYGRLQFDYAAYCKPDGESLRNEARNNLEEYIAELEEENDRLQAAWFVEETICPDGSLKPKVSALLSRIAELERDKKALRGIEENLREHIDIGTLQLSVASARIAELKAYIDQLIEIGSWAITGMTITTSYSPGEMQNLAEKKSDDWYALINNLKECDKEKEREE